LLMMESINKRLLNASSYRELFKNISYFYISEVLLRP
jgi:hypothetical protein